MRQLRALWTHGSTALEGNTLTLGDTMFVLEYGLTVKGKPLRDQVDVQNHARAVDLLMDIVGKSRLDENDLFELHKAVINEQSRDIYKPVGAYKREDNGTYRLVGGRSVYHAYLPAADVPRAVGEWLVDFNRSCKADASQDEAADAYVDAHMNFTAIHPFYDGNGRIARLVSNIPVLVAGYPPIVIPVESREDYMKAIWLSEDKGDASAMKTLVRDCWRATLDLVAEAHESAKSASA